MATRAGFTVSVRIEGAAAKLAMFNKVGSNEQRKLGSQYLRQASGDIASDMVGWTKSAASAEGRQAAILGGFVKVKQDRVPVVVVAPTGKLWRGKADGSQREGFRTLAGSEFGGRGHGFTPWRGRSGIWFFPTASAHQAEVAVRWNAAMAKLIRDMNSDSL
jgi:hypothetical protein